MQSMATTQAQAQKLADANSAKSNPAKSNPRTARAYGVFFAGWIVPGAGHFMERRWWRGLLVFAAVVAMFSCGLAMGGKIYSPNAGDVLDILGFFGDLGAAGLYCLARIAGWGAAPVQVVVADYGTKFIVVAGLLNFIAAVDAHDIALGKKR
jgi:hypothetical protein